MVRGLELELLKFRWDLAFVTSDKMHGSEREQHSLSHLPKSALSPGFCFSGDRLNPKTNIALSGYRNISQNSQDFFEKS